MSLHTLKTVQKLPITLEQAWDFLSSPGNLKVITPPHMSFEVTSGFTPGDKMYSGMMISYNVCPFPGVKMQWVTEITHVRDLNYFVDEQRFGPYTLWHHKHFLNAVEGGVEMVDLIHYKIPLGFLGDIMNSLVIKKQLSNIFNFRYKKLQELFGAWPNEKELMEFKTV